MLLGQGWNTKLLRPIARLPREYARCPWVASSTGCYVVASPEEVIELGASLFDVMHDVLGQYEKGIKKARKKLAG